MEPLSRRLRKWGAIAAVIQSLCLAISGSSWAIDNGDSIHIGYDETGNLVWAPAGGYTAWNVYTGDLQVLRNTGEYTQAASALAERWCDRNAPSVHTGDTPAPGQCSFQIVSGLDREMEGGLGTNSGGGMRFNARACHPDSTPPEPPDAPKLFPGHCGAFWTTWTASPSPDVISYRAYVLGFPTGGPLWIPVTGPPGLIEGLWGGPTYYVAVRAVDASGNLSEPSSENSATLSNFTVPRAPDTLSATLQLDATTLVWAPVTANVNDTAGDPDSPLIRDLAGYLVYRSNASSVPLDAQHRIAGAGFAPFPPTKFFDAAVVACRPYAYAVTAVDTCGVESAPSPQVDALVTSTVAPEPPANVQVVPTGSANVVGWSAPSRNVDHARIFVDKYRVERTPPVSHFTPVNDGMFVPLADVTGGATSFVDAGPPQFSDEESIYYRVRALDDCPNVSDPSGIVEASCQVSGDVWLSPPDGTITAGVVFPSVGVSGGTDTYTGVTITYTHDTLGLMRTYTSTTPGWSWTDDPWLASPAGGYTIEARVTTSRGCTATKRVHITAGNAAGCCVSLYPTTTTIASCGGGAIKCKEVSYRIGNNQCLTPVALSGMNVQWIDNSGRKPHWVTAKFNGTAIAAAGSWTTTYDGQTPEHGSAQKTNFSAPSPTVPYATPMTSGNTSLVTYVFDNFTDFSSGATRKVNVFGTNQFTFTLLDANGSPSDVTATCNMPPLTVN